MNQEQIQNALIEHGLSDVSIAVHSSLKSFGHVDDGAISVASALINICRNVMAPSFCEIGRTNPPMDDRPLQNGWDYDSRLIDVEDIVSFDPDTFGISSDINVSEMGQISRSLLLAPGTVRSMHPSVSWCCNGPDAEWLMADHSSSDPNLPIKRLAEIGGHVLLLGVDLAACTAIHLAEEIAGRRPFIRWVKYVDGSVRRVREYGCSDGFAGLTSDLSKVLAHFEIGKCIATTANLSDLVISCVELIKANPTRTVCRRSGTCRCQDVARGGPIEYPAGQSAPLELTQ